jgi:hypothetical protein
MAVHEFSLETKRDVSCAIAEALGVDKPMVGDAAEIELRKIIRMSLVWRDGNHEQPVQEWFERDLRGQGVSLSSIVRGVELAATRHAAYQFGGECIYILYFHSKDHDNRSSFFFKIYGGQEVQSLAVVQSHSGMMRMGGGGGGFGLGSQTEAGIAERLMPAVLEYVSKKEARLDERTMHLLDMYQKREVHHDLVRQQYTDRETKLREIEIAADGLVYEQKKKEKADEESEALKKRIFEGLEKHGPALLMTLLSMIQRRSGDALPPEFKEWFAEEKKRKAPSKPKTSTPSSNGTTNGNGASNGHVAPTPAETKPPQSVEVPDAEVEQEEEEVSSSNEDDEPSDLDKLRLNVALGAAQFLSLVRARGRWDAVRAALGEEVLALWDALDEATSAEDVASDQGIEKVARLALMFGAMAKADPSVGVAVLGTLDDFCRVSLLNLTTLLEQYHNAGGHL